MAAIIGGGAAILIPRMRKPPPCAQGCARARDFDAPEVVRQRENPGAQHRERRGAGRRV
jgi:hypothetical protein